MDILIFSLLVSLVIVCAIISIIGTYVGKTFQDSYLQSSDENMSLKDIGKVLLNKYDLDDVRIKWKKDGDNCFILNKNKIQINKKYKHFLSIKGIATICHECGHAILYNTGYPPSTLRHRFPQYYTDPLLMVLYMFFSYVWISAGLLFLPLFFLLLFSVYSIMTLVDEWKASSLGLKELERCYTMYDNNKKHIKRMKLYLFSCWCSYLSRELFYFEWLLLLIFFMWLFL